MKKSIDEWKKLFSKKRKEALKKKSRTKKPIGRPKPRPKPKSILEEKGHHIPKPRPRPRKPVIIGKPRLPPTKGKRPRRLPKIPCERYTLPIGKKRKYISPPRRKRGLKPITKRTLRPMTKGVKTPKPRALR